MAIADQFVADGAEASSGGVAQPPGRRRSGQETLHETLQRGGVGNDVGLESEVAASEHDGGPVITDRSRGDEDISLGDPGRGKLPAGRYGGDTGCRDVHAVGRTVLDDFRVAGHDVDTGGG